MFLMKRIISELNRSWIYAHIQSCQLLLNWQFRGGKQSNFSLRYHYFHRSDSYLHYNMLCIIVRVV